MYACRSPNRQPEDVVDSPPIVRSVLPASEDAGSRSQDGAREAGPAAKVDSPSSAKKQIKPESDCPPEKDGKRPSRCIPKEELEQDVEF